MTTNSKRGSSSTGGTKEGNQPSNKGGRGGHGVRSAGVSREGTEGTNDNSLKDIFGVWNEVLSKANAVPTKETADKISSSVLSEHTKKLLKTHNKHLVKLLQERIVVRSKLPEVTSLLSKASDTDWDNDSSEMLTSLEKKLKDFLEIKKKLENDVDTILENLEQRSVQNVETANPSSPIKPKHASANEEGSKTKIERLQYEVDKLIDENEKYTHELYQTFRDLQYADIDVSVLIPPCNTCAKLEDKINALEKTNQCQDDPVARQTETKSQRSQLEQCDLKSDAKFFQLQTEKDKLQNEGLSKDEINFLEKNINPSESNRKEKCSVSVQCELMFDKTYSQLQKENDKLHKELLSKDEIIRILNENTDSLQKSNQQAVAGKSPLKKSRSNHELQSPTIAELKLQVHDLSQRLSAEMHQKIAKDESSVENVSIKDRPMNVADEYRTICDIIWMDAKFQLDSSSKTDRKEQRNVEFLEEILTTSAVQASKVYENVWNILAEPVSYGDVAMDVRKKVPEYLRVQVGDFFRISADRINYDCLVQRIKECVLGKGGDTKSEKEIFQDKMLGYVNSCAQLGWKMAIQRPPMTFRKPYLNEQWKGNAKVEPAWKSKADNRDAKVLYYLYPLMYHGDKMMVRGKAFIA